ncbi:hypothetical protein Scep_022229 [Stephania cephalantha]|uniref:DUF4283 domain-containing protein n=1 Tax=Stephania cephalantha TaxID=152367 RepID=A0AAP0F4Z5_9MAGN
MTTNGFDVEQIARYEYDQEIVLKGGPWSYDNQLIVLLKPEGIGDLEALDFTYSSIWIQIHRVPLAFMTHKVATYIGNKIGTIEEVDLGALGDCEGKFLQIKVKINLLEPLPIGLKVDLQGAGHKVSLVLQYERLPDFCFHHDRIGHRYGDYVLLQGKEVRTYQFTYGKVMRVRPTIPQKSRLDRPQENFMLGRGRNAKGGRGNDRMLSFFHHQQSLGKDFSEEDTDFLFRSQTPAYGNIMKTVL